MEHLKRRDFLKYAGISGALLFSKVFPFGLIKNAFSEDVKEINITAAINMIDLGDGKKFKAWTYNAQIPGPEIRIKEGETLRIILKNSLPEGTTIHWHGVPVPNKMDGVPNVTQKPIQPGESFVYEFNASPPGTYIYHTHASYQLDRGLYGALIIEPKKEERSYDREYVLMLEDWAQVDGGGPEASKTGRIRPGMGMTGMMGMMGRREGQPLMEPFYDVYTINGKVFDALQPFKVKKGDKVKLRIINPSSSTIYTLRIAGHPLTITHTDGRAVIPLEVDALRIAMGERYDVEFTANNPGRWHIYNIIDGSPASGWLLGSIVYEGIKSNDFSGDNLSHIRINDYSLLEGAAEGYVKLLKGKIDRVFRMTLSGGMMSPYWTINGRVYPDSDNITIKAGEKVRFEYFNMSMMHHPLHLHGHFFEVVGTGRNTGSRIKKDTLIIPAHMGRGAVEFIADNPGTWFHHCHHLYHMVAGMANLVKVE